MYLNRKQPWRASRHSAPLLNDPWCESPVHLGPSLPLLHLQNSMSRVLVGETLAEASNNPCCSAENKS